MFTPLLTLALVAGADPQPNAPVRRPIEMPKLTEGPGPLKPLSYQAPRALPALAAPLKQTQPSLCLRVKECERKPEIFGGGLADVVGRPHKWLVVEDAFGNTIHAPGLGNKRGAPGANGQSSPDWPLSKTFVRDHTHEVARSCKPVLAVDPLCVIARAPYNQYEGRWLPFANDCNTFSQRIVQECRLPRLSDCGPLHARPSTVWDKVSLLPKSDGGASGVPTPGRATKRPAGMKVYDAPAGPLPPAGPVPRIPSSAVEACRPFYESKRGTGWSNNYLDNAITACEVTGNGPKAREIRQCLQEQTEKINGKAVVKLREHDRNATRRAGLALWEGPQQGEAKLLYDIHKNCYDKAACKGQPAPVGAWELILSNRWPASMIRAGIEQFGPCSGVRGRFEPKK